jgi:hypothetical protein
MTTYTLSQASSGPVDEALGRKGSWLAASVAAVVAGAALGVADVAWSVRGGPLWTAIGNSCAGWAMAAFVLGFLLRLDVFRSAVAGVVMLAVAVETYYAAAWQVLGSSRSIMTSDVALTWLVLAVLVGAPLGAAGGMAASSRSRVLAAVGFAAGAAIPLGDALHLRLTSAYVDRGIEVEALLLAAALVLLPALRRPTVLVLAVAFCVPAAAVVAQCFELTGVSV